ncbi:MAG: CBS domain-containing protein [Ferrovum sp.]|jgi:magnesium and cobalt transporter|nr:CBS domain-containing protein [Ferrovum sp.]NDU87022.1 CBS domain-containing protein [Ferrovum sp.]
MIEDTPNKPSLLERLSHWLHHEPENRDELVAILHQALERNLLDTDALTMMEGVLGVAEMQVRDVMIPRAQMDVIDLQQTPEEIIPFLIETAHSRFPAIDGGKDHVVGILLAKDMLRFTAGQPFQIRDSLRPAVFVPESKRLNVLLREFRSNRNHMAMVVDEYGGVSGLVTIEDVLEQIVGDIEDEYDFDETEDNIVPEGEDHYRVKALTELNDFNEFMGTTLNAPGIDTVGGLVTSHFGRLPKRGELITFSGLQVKILRADSRRLHSVSVTLIPPKNSLPLHP